ncbi:type II toxin-antitoxin system VapC family toxin [Acidithiobacillus ferriphilus]|uniref:type II toxin-antitoxin system VapC family toxin n=1 Tax=Acidithiobacillus ferriphilus TaxID=1689834 RepID=UPI001C068ED6|nr:type II toxin-antitoxin system VapC family toxin [Acidithiobacillus ferriphilus]MBU2848634.1 type II toxin-antitoxin system VapC family toxin [Acidithiobacillus ferriphilus]
MLIDSNLIIYATQVQHQALRSWLVAHASHYSAITRLETLGYPNLQEAEQQAIMAILDQLELLMIGSVTMELAIALRRQRKMTLGDALIAATCLEHQLPLASANEKDFTWINGLIIHNPLRQEAHGKQNG